MARWPIHHALAKCFWLFGILIGLALGAEATAKAAPVPSLESLTYSIRTTYDAGGGCGNEKLTNAIIGVPRCINVGGNFLPDVSVVLVALPPTDGTPAVLQVLVTRLRDDKGAVETIVTPSAGASKRFAFGYDGCESGVPATFSATMTASADPRLGKRHHSHQPSEPQGARFVLRPGRIDPRQPDRHRRPPRAGAR